MLNTSRFYSPEGTYFVHLRLIDVQSHLLIEHVNTLRMAFRLCCTRWPFEIRDAVVLPDQMLMIARLPKGDTAYAKRLRFIKCVFARHAGDAAQDAAQDGPQAQDCKIWQHRFRKHAILDNVDYRRHRERVLMAPVAAGLVSEPERWPWSSIHRDGALVCAPDASFMASA